MKSLKSIVFFILVVQATFAQNATEIGPNSLTLPRLTISQRNALTPIPGFIIYNLSNNQVEYFDGVSWKSNASYDKIKGLIGLAGPIGIGKYAIENLSDISNMTDANIAIGHYAGRSLTTNSTYNNNNNILIGLRAGAYLGVANNVLGANDNIMIGHWAGEGVTPAASGNILIGYEVGRFSSPQTRTETTYFNNNIVLGGRNLQYAPIASFNISIGTENMNRSNDVRKNIVVGNYTASDFTGDDNLFLGNYNATGSSDRGSNNVVLGNSAAVKLTGSSNIIIGSNAAGDVKYNNINNRLIISNQSTATPLIEGEFDNKKLTINGKLSTDGLAINGDPKPSAVVDLSNSTKGFLPPRLSNYQRNQINSPEIGLTIFNTDSNCLEFFVAGGWYNVCQNKLVAVTDIDGNSYGLVTIGSQVWLDQNLNVTKFNNGDVITELKAASDWIGSGNPAWCWYGNTAKSNYIGKLYNWKVANDSRNVCPQGFHIPTDDEWTALTNLYGGENLAAGPLKQTGTTTWASPNTGATNISKFTATSNGYRNFENTIYTDANYFSALGSYGTWWTKTSFDATRAYHRYMYWGEVAVNRGASNKINGFGIRCIKD